MKNITIKTKEQANGIVIFASDENKVRYNIVPILEDGETGGECACALVEKLDKPADEMYRATETPTFNPQDVLE